MDLLLQRYLLVGVHCTDYDTADPTVASEQSQVRTLSTLHKRTHLLCYCISRIHAYQHQTIQIGSLSQG